MICSDQHMQNGILYMDTRSGCLNLERKSIPENETSDLMGRPIKDCAINNVTLDRLIFLAFIVVRNNAMTRMNSVTCCLQQSKISGKNRTRF